MTDVFITFQMVLRLFIFTDFTDYKQPAWLGPPLDRDNRGPLARDSTKPRRSSK